MKFHKLLFKRLARGGGASVEVARSSVRVILSYIESRGLAWAFSNTQKNCLQLCFKCPYADLWQSSGDSQRPPLRILPAHNSAGNCLRGSLCLL